MSKQKYPTTSVVSTTTGDSKGVSKRKINGYHSEKLHAKRDKKRQEAQARQRHYESLTIKQRISLAKSSPGDSKKELIKLQKQLARETASPKVEAIKVSTPPAVVAVTEKKTRKSDIVKAAKAMRPSKS